VHAQFTYKAVARDVVKVLAEPSAAQAAAAAAAAELCNIFKVGSAKAN
jgi:hypothetical protein